MAKIGDVIANSMFGERLTRKTLGRDKAKAVDPIGQLAMHDMNKYVRPYKDRTRYATIADRWNKRNDPK